MHPSQMRTWAEVNLSAISANYREIKSRLPKDCILMGVVKANAYGHGAVAVARLLESLECGYLGVSCFAEAMELRESGINIPILILGYTDPTLAPELSRRSISQTIVSAEMAGDFSKALASEGLSIKVHIKLDSGMGRLGFDIDSISPQEDIAPLIGLPGLEFEGIFTHFAVADVYGDPFTAEQCGKFFPAVAEIEGATGHIFKIKHCANSGAVINYKELYLDMVRPGLALYGHYPAKENGGFLLTPSMSLKTRVAFISNLRPGDTVSYGRIFTADRHMRVAVLPIGYADGLHRTLSGKMEFLIRGKTVKQIGHICMDMCMVDITHVPECEISDIALVFGYEKNNFLPINNLAESAGTISYELLCAVSPRVKRVYID